ncbi:uncharacterized protein K452DRAFT_288476 [Aplosporella prunicola CBS 121167]|uniref:Receptor L-domain domain-containing protein n=1 Tax=Aplosporella prunicola CBS 121167 TaxID=1176127 RepID=A0A6A6BDU8_9PEZI|nr:uncharacterized protein K452DRAFT_288476 [Aplosporella prunicola CBS 121167]KAF2141097.1 hypothetical protein K452DRAFT_288476 [Aplosporella prunicola CBS 121167]
MMLYSFLLLPVWLRQVSAGCSGTTTISVPADVQSLAACPTFSGDVTLGQNVRGHVSLNGIEVIKGNLNISGSHRLKSISSGSLRSMNKFFLEDLETLSNITFPNLTHVEEIRWNGLTALPRLNFTTNITEASTVDIRNTHLETLEGLGLDRLRSIGEGRISDNMYLETLHLPQLQQITSSLTVAANGQHLNLSMPNLTTTLNMSLRNISELSVPSLQSVNGSLGIYGTGIDTFSAPNLTQVQSFLGLVGNSRLSNLSLPKLGSVQQIGISDNMNLTNIALNALSSIGGDATIWGNFSNISFPSLKGLDGHLDLASTGNASCSIFKHLADAGIITGGLDCNNSAGSIHVAPVAEPETPADSHASSSSLTTGEKAGIGVGVGGGVIGIICVVVLVIVLLRNRRKNQAAVAAAEDGKSDTEKGERLPEEPAQMHGLGVDTNPPPPPPPAPQPQELGASPTVSGPPPAQPAADPPVQELGAAAPRTPSPLPPAQPQELETPTAVSEMDAPQQHGDWVDVRTLTTTPSPLPPPSPGPQEREPEQPNNNVQELEATRIFNELDPQDRGFLETYTTSMVVEMPGGEIPEGFLTPGQQLGQPEMETHTQRVTRTQRWENGRLVESSESSSESSGSRDGGGSAGRLLGGQ